MNCLAVQKKSKSKEKDNCLGDDDKLHSTGELQFKVLVKF